MSDSEKILQDVVRESILMVIINDKLYGTGFVVEEDTLVTDFHIYELIYKNGIEGALSSLSITNTKGERFYIKGVRGINILADLVLLKIKDYKGSSLDIANPTEAHLSNKSKSHKFYLMGFPDGKFQFINNLTKNEFETDSMNQKFYHSYENTLSSASGSPIVNKKGKVVSVLKWANSITISGIRREILQDFLNETRHQEIVSDNEAIHDHIKKEYKNLQTLATQGDADAQYALIMTLLDQDNTQAQVWLRKAANQGNMEAQYHLGLILYPEGNIEQAKGWLKKAANQGHVDAQYNLGWILYHEGNIEQAKIFWEEAANQGQRNAQFELGVILLNEGDVEQAKVWWKKAAVQGHKAALNNLLVISFRVDSD